jgi:hypothetical protein
LRAARIGPIEPTQPVPSSPLPPPPAEPPAVKRSLIDWIGARATRRPEPRVGVSLAGAGSAMLVFGAVVISGDQLISADSGGGSQFPGIVITLAVVVAGVVAAARYRTGPLAAAGVAASGIALLPFFFFLTYSKNSAPSFGTILLLSTLGWIAGYLLAPSRGHAFYLALALVGLWLWVVEVTEKLFSFPIGFLFALANVASSSAVGGSSSSDFGFKSGPDATTIGGYTLAFAVVYLVVGRVLDRRELRGMATPFMFAGILTLIIGIAAVADDLGEVPTGLVLAVTGAVLCYFGATESRRGTNWAGAILAFLGVTTVVTNPFDSPTAGGMAELAAGAVVILLAHWISTQFHEPRETDAVLSRFYSVGSVQPSGPPPPPAGSVLG